MKYLVLAFVFAAGFAAAHLTGFTTAADPAPPAPPRVEPPNPNIDMDGFLNGAQAAAKHRASRRLSEADFLKMSQEEGVIVLDARSKAMYDMLHVKGAINLSFPDITVESLARVLPDRDVRILIYCNNNFANAERPFPSKRAEAALNLSTYVSLYSYGYRNVYELAPLVDLADSKLDFESSPDQVGDLR